MPRPSPEIASVVRDRIDEWHASGRSDALGTLAEYPELRDYKSLYLDLVLAEYAVRVAAGDEISHSEFCSQFPAHQASIVHQLEAEDFIDRCPAFAGLAEELRWPAVGETFLGSQIVESLGRGGLARVFLARELDVGGRFVVLKVSRFGSDEAHKLGKIAHESIVPIYSVKEDLLRGLSAICMPLLGVATGVDLLDAAFAKGASPPAGHTVSQVAHRTRPLTKVPVPAQEKHGFLAPATYSEAIGALALQLAEGLAAAHACGILHRDIKPSNVLLGWSGRAMLLDFNLATGDEHAGQRIGGTLVYSAPEMIDCLLHERFAEARRFDPRGDIYSLGAVLFQLLAGRLPHGAPPHQPRPDDYEGWLACKRQSLEPLGPNSLADAAIARIVQKCLALDAADRYQTAAQLVADLRAYVQPRAKLSRLVVRRRREFVLGGIAAGIAGAVGAWVVASRPTELDVEYQAGLAAYDDGEFGQAVECFSRCLEIKAGWPPALFGRAQSLRRAEKFRDAREDFVRLAAQEPGWSYAFAGYCSMRANDYKTAIFDFSHADRKGLQSVDYLLNYAEVCRKSDRCDEAARLYNRVLTIDPANKFVFRERAQMRLQITGNQKDTPPDLLMLQDAERYYQLEPSYDGPYQCVRVLFEAALKNPYYRAKAVGYLRESIRRGLPSDRFDNWRVAQLLPLVDLKEIEVEQQTVPPSISEGRFYIAPPAAADWNEFRRTYSHA